MVRQNTQHRTLALTKSGFSWSHSLNFEYIKFRDKDFIWIQIYLILLHLALLHFADNVLFYKLKVCGNPASDKSFGAIFPTAFAQSISVSHFGNSQYLKLFIIVIFVMMICGQWPLMLLLRLFWAPWTMLM